MGRGAANAPRRGLLPTLNRDHMPDDIGCSGAGEDLCASAIGVFKGDGP